MEEEYTQCQGPGCTRKVKQASTGRGHRARLYCGKNCRMAACRTRQRAAEAEAERQRLLALELAEKEEIQKRFPPLTPESVHTLYQLKKQYGVYIVSVVGTALLRERERATPAPQPKDLLQANIISWGHQLGFPAVCEQGIDVPGELAGWWHYTNYTPVEVLELFFSIVKRLHLEPQPSSKVSA